MSIKAETEQQLSEILHKSAKILNLKNYSLNLNVDALIGDGFVSEFFKVSLIDNDAKTEIKLAIKKAPILQNEKQQTDLQEVYQNEIYFYSTLYPALQEFEKKHQIPKPFHSVPQYVTSVSDPGKEMIVLKDITADGFELRDKQLLFDQEHVEFIFKRYGHYHAISFCLKDQKPEEYNALVKPLTNLWKKIGGEEKFLVMMSKILEQALEAIGNDINAPIIEQTQKYINNMKENFQKVVDYRGNYSCILHGDCWSNNMMFKYQNSKLVEINLLDFQLATPGSPIYDLSYFFYSGGTKDLFDKLEYFLDIYHQSFSETAKRLGGDPDKLLPRENLSQDWKEYSKLGMLMSILLIKLKLVNKEASVELAEEAHNESDNGDDAAFLKVKCDEELFGKRSRDVLEHMYEIDAL